MPCRAAEDLHPAQAVRSKIGGRSVMLPDSARVLQHEDWVLNGTGNARRDNSGHEGAGRVGAL